MVKMKSLYKRMKDGNCPGDLRTESLIESSIIYGKRNINLVRSVKNENKKRKNRKFRYKLKRDIEF